MSESLKRLREITDDLPPFPAALEKSKGFKNFKTLRGTMMGWAILTQPEITVASIFASKDTLFPKHTLEQREWLIVYKGSVIIEVEGEEPVRLTSGMWIVIEPRTVHSASYPEDCWLLAVTVPQSLDLPE